MEQAGIQLIAQGASAFDADMKRATGAVDSFVDGTEKGGGRVSAAGQVMIGGLRELGSMATQAFAEAAKATAAFVGESIGLAGDFEAGMLNFQAVAGKDVDTKGLEQFRDLFLQIGKELPVSTAEVQQAATEMIKGGIDPAIVAAGGLRQNIQFAAAAMEGDLVAAAEISSKILGGWADANATAQQKTDFLTTSTNLLTKAANASAVDVKGLSLGIFNSQGIAKTAGVSFEDLTTTLAALAPRFASSSEAGNSLKNMIARLQPTTDPAASAMEGLGLYTEETGSAFYDATGNFVGFEAAAQMLQDSLKGLTNEQKAATLQQIFGNDAMGSAAALADMGAAGYANMAAAMAEANGVAENAALKQQGFNTAMDNAKGSAEALQITIGSYLLPVLTDLFNNVVSPAVNTLTDMADALGGNEEAFARLSPTMQDVTTTIQQLADDFTKGVQAAQDIAAEVQSLVGAFSSTSKASDALGGAVDDLSGVWTAASKVVADVMAGYEAVAKAVLPQIQQFVNDHGDEISAFFKSAWDSIIDIVTLAIELYGAIVPPMLQAIAGFINDHGEEIQKVLSGAWTIITSIITGTLETIKGVIQLALNLINGDWDAAWGDIKGIADTQVTAIGGVITGFLDMIAGLFNTSMGDIKKTWENNWNMLVEIANKIGGRMVEAGSNIVAGIVEGIQNNASAIYGVLEDIAQGAIDAFLSAIGASSPAKAFMPAGSFAMQGVMAGMEQMLPALMGLVDATGQGMIDRLTKNISKGGDVIRKMMDDLTKDIKDIGEQINDAIADSFGATASIDRQIAKNLDKLKDVPETYKQFTEGALKQVQKQAEAMADPAEGAKYFKMRSDQILEYAKLQQDLAEAESQDDRDRITQKMILINRAQEAELLQYSATQRGQASPQDDIAAQIAALFQSNDVARNLPGALQSTIVAQLMGLLDQLRNAAPTPQQGYASPPAQQGWQAGATNTSNSRVYNMPIYTNNSPAALQQSLAVMQASTP